jgi:hypothetical protein
MPISLTLEEFLERLSARYQLLEVAIEKDVNDISPYKIKVDSNQTDIHIDLTKLISELLLKVMVRVITLVYEESLD